MCVPFFVCACFLLNRVFAVGKLLKLLLIPRARVKRIIKKAADVHILFSVETKIVKIIRSRAIGQMDNENTVNRRIFTAVKMLKIAQNRRIQFDFE